VKQEAGLQGLKHLFFENLNVATEQAAIHQDDL